MISKLNFLLCERIHGEANHTAVYILVGLLFSSEIIILMDSIECIEFYF